MEAKYHLEDIFDIINSGDEDSIWFSARSRSTGKVIEVYGATPEPKSETEANRFILDAILTLTPGDFVENGYQWEVVTDIYALEYDDRPWFIKFCIEEGDLNEISFHPPEKPMTTVSGKTIG